MNKLKMLMVPTISERIIMDNMKIQKDTIVGKIAKKIEITKKIKKMPIVN